MGQGENFIAFIMIARFFSSSSNKFNWCYASEIYNTKYRVTGVSFCSACGRASGVVLPFSSIYLHEKDPFLPYLFLGCLLLVATVSTVLLPYDLKGIELDLSHDDI